MGLDISLINGQLEPSNHHDHDHGMVSSRMIKLNFCVFDIVRLKIELSDGLFKVLSCFPLASASIYNGNSPTFNPFLLHVKLFFFLGCLSLFI